MMHNLNLTMPTHVTEALRTNMSGGKTVAQMLSEAAAAVPFMSLAELGTCLEQKNDLVILDVRGKGCFQRGPYSWCPAAATRPAGAARQSGLPDPTRRIIVYCEFGRVSTLATHTLRQMGFTAAVALDGGMKAWRESGRAVQAVAAAN